jgi:plasmid replication initiation protein
VEEMPSERPPEQLTWLLQPGQSSIVKQENRLVEARYSLTARELKLVLYAIAMIDPRASDFGMCQIRVQDFAELTGTDPNSLYRELRATAEQIRRKDLVLENYPEKNMHGEIKFRRIATSWFINVITDANGDGYLAVLLEPKLKPFLLQLKGQYTKFQLGYAVRMKSQYGIRLYQLAQRWAYKGERTLALDELRLCLGTREINGKGEVVKDHLVTYNNFKRKALLPAVEEVNRHSDLSVEFKEEKSKTSKSVAAIRFLIRRNVATADQFDGLPSSTGCELPSSQQSQLDALADEFRLSEPQTKTLVDYVEKDGLDYVLEKAEIARKQPNPAAAFIKALREDWKKPVPKASNKPNPKPKAPLAPPEPPPAKPDFEPMARLWAEATELQRTAWLKDDLLRQTAPKEEGEPPRPVFLARLYCLTQPAEV